jgi:hypothetical protein
MRSARPPLLAALALSAALLGRPGRAGGAAAPARQALPAADAPAICAALGADYAAAVSAAQVCHAGEDATCGAARVRVLDDPCRCEVAVNPAGVARLDAVAARYRAAACAPPAGLCTRRCRAPVARCEAPAGEPARCG